MYFENSIWNVSHHWLQLLHSSWYVWRPLANLLYMCSLMLSLLLRLWSLSFIIFTVFYPLVLLLSIKKNKYEQVYLYYSLSWYWTLSLDAKHAYDWISCLKTFANVFSVWMLPGLTSSPPIIQSPDGNVMPYLLPYARTAFGPSLILPWGS